MGGDPRTPISPGGAGSTLLRSKLRTPTVAAGHFVRRQRLFDLLDDLVTCPLTLVVAPAGAGKTQLLAGWIAESPMESAWLSLDETDRDGTQLWSSLIAALQSLLPGTGGKALRALHRSRPLTDVAAELLNELDAETSSPRLLVIDDAQVVDGEADLAQSLGTFLLHLPGWLHIVLLSRRDLEVPVDRLRARGQLGEIHFAELRFSAAEASELLSRLAPSLSTDQIDDLALRVDGWAAGLQMAALAARSNHAHSPPDGLHAARELLLDDFVWHEILRNEAPHVVELLLDIAVVERVNAGLANALSRRRDAAEVLQLAEARGLFVIRHGVAGWFEVHSLVRSALLAELARRSPSRLAELHARAAQWYQDEGEVTAALEHWVLAGRQRDALRLLAATHNELYDTGREATILRTVEAIPAEVTARDFTALLEYAWCLLLVSRQRCAAAVDEATWWADHVQVDQGLRRRLTMLQATVSVIHGDWAQSGSLAKQVIREMGDLLLGDPLGRVAWNAVAREAALSERWDESSADVRDAELALRSDPQRRLALEGTRAIGHALAGRPVEALRAVAGVRRVASVTNMSVLRGELAIAEAIAHRELGDRSRAVTELRVLADTPAETMIYCRVLASLELVQAELDAGHVGEARIAFDRATTLIETESMRAGAREWLARVGTLLALATGEVDHGLQWAARLDDPFWRGVSHARMHLATANHGDAVAALDTAKARCERHEVILGLLRARAADDHDEAVKYATAALEVATANEMLQTVASEGPEALELIERAAWRAPPPWLDRLRRLATSTAERPGADRSGLVESLTDRERDVLRLLPSRLTVKEIADELYVSVNTLKFHLKVIYRKLGVSSRAEAAARARDLMA